MFYKLFTKNLKFPQKFKEKWNAIINPPNGIDWQGVYRNNFSVSKDTRLRWFQFRLIHRILATNRYLYLIKIRNDPYCSFCKVEEETIVHLFYECDVVNNFYYRLEDWIYNKTSVLLNLSKMELIFGKMCRNDVLNLIILVFKFHIYRQRCRNENLCLSTFKAELHYFYQIENYLSAIHGKQTCFKAKWEKFSKLFEDL